MILAATLDATVLLLLELAEVPLMSCVPLTVMLDTVVLLLPLTVMVATGPPTVDVTTGENPVAAAGPTIVTVLPEALAL